MISEDVTTGKTTNSSHSIKPNPYLVSLITKTVPDLTKDGISLPESVYLLCREFLKKTLDPASKKDIALPLFVYYLQVYREVHRDTIEDDTEAFNGAALSLFDLYFTRPENPIVRTLLTLSAKSIHEVITAGQASSSTRSLMEVIGDLATIALLADTVSTYIKGKRRITNYPYIKWLKTFFETALQAEDISALRDDPTTFMVVSQIRASGKTITV